jgi:transcriptional regulator
MLLALCRRGFSQAEIAQKITKERQNWQNHTGLKKMEKYLKRTIEKACKIVSDKN